MNGMFSGSNSLSKPYIGAVGGGSSVSFANVLSESSGTNTIAFSSSNEFKSQIFTAPSNGNIGKARFKLWVGAGSVSGTIQGQLWSVSGTQVTTKIKDATATFNVSGLPGSKPGSFNVEFNFTSEALISGTKYAVALDGTGLTVDGSNYVAVSRTGGDVYASGAFALGVVGAQPFTEDASSRDLDFEIDYITSGPATSSDGGSNLGGFGF